MRKNEIIESGLLELFVAGALDNKDRQLVLKALNEFPELKYELVEIEHAFKYVAHANAVTPSAGLRSKVLSQIPKTNVPDAVTSTPKVKPAGSGFLWPFILTAVSLIGLFFYYMNKNNSYNTLLQEREQEKIICDSIETENSRQSDLLSALTSRNIQILEVDPTDKYPNTSLYMYNDQSTKKNFIQIKNLPSLAANQSYQLWSLKDGSDPIPLDVFEGSQDLFEVEFIDDTKNYAITIEQKGGSKVPTLDNLIGIIPVT